MDVLVFFNGQFLPESQAVVPVNDRGFLLGDGLFETVRVVGGKPFRFAQHLERLAAGADFLKIKMPFTPVEFQKFAGKLIEINQLPESGLRLTLTRGSGVRGYSTQGADKPMLAMTLHPLLFASTDQPLRWRLITSSLRVPAGDVLAAFKTTSKVLNVLARAEAEAGGADEALILNTNGEVVETAGGNIFWVSDGQVCTVPTSRGALPGVTRAVVLDMCKNLGLKTKESVAKPEQLIQAEGGFVTQTVLGIVPVITLDHFPIASSLLLEQLAHAYREIVRAEAAGF